MKLDQELAEQLRSQAKSILGRAVIITDPGGTVLAAAKDQETSDLMIDALRSCQEGRVVRSEIGDEPIAWCPIVYENETLGSCGIIESYGRVTAEAVNLLQSLAEVIAHQHFLNNHMQSSDAMRENLLREILTNSRLSAEEAYRQADILQLDLRNSYGVIMLNLAPKPADKAGQPDLEKLVRGVVHSDDLLCKINDHRWALLRSIPGVQPNTRNTARFLREQGRSIHKTLTEASKHQLHVTIGVGQFYPQLGGLRKSYQDARLALEVGSKVWDHGHPYHIKQVGMYVTLANVNQERKAELAYDILSPLVQDEQLYRSVTTLLDSGLNLTDAAEKLHIHRNTLIYRLEKTKSLIDLDPRNFDDALQIKLGLLFYKQG